MNFNFETLYYGLAGILYSVVLSCPILYLLILIFLFPKLSILLMFDFSFLFINDNI